MRRGSESIATMAKHAFMARLGDEFMQVTATQQKLEDEKRKPNIEPQYGMMRRQHGEQKSVHQEEEDIHSIIAKHGNPTR